MKTLKKQTRLTDTRDFIRFITLLSVPWLGWLTANLLGTGEFEFETEIVVTAMFVIFGSYWCGWFCPFGNLSYFISKIGKRLFPKAQITVPVFIDKPLRYVKYCALALFAYALIANGINYFLDDHMAMYRSTWMTSLYIDSKKYFILLVPLLLPQFFCKYLCFQKGLYNIINKIFPLAVISRDEDRCIDCKKCDRVCPMDLPVSTSVKISGNDCLGCYNCVDEDVCPAKANAIKLRYFGKTVKPLHLGMMATVIYLAATCAVLYCLG